MNTYILPTFVRLGVAILVAAWSAGGAVTVADEPKPGAPAPTEKDASPEHVGKLIRQLGDKDYYARQKAQEELGKLGFEAVEALDAALADDDLEISSRARYLLRLMRIEWTAEADPPEVKNLLRGYENMDARTRTARMQAMARLPDAKGVAALCRLARFERSSLLSKAAAVALLCQEHITEPPSKAAIDVIRKKLQNSKRPAAVWLVAWTRMAADPKATIAEWTTLIDAEMALLKQTPEETSPEIVAKLTRFQVAWLKKLGKEEDVATAIRRLVAVNPDDPQSINSLLAWLIEQKAWKAVDDLARRFPARFSSEPSMLYMLAQTYADRGETQRAKEAAQRALRMYPGKQDEQVLRHYSVAQLLRSRGQTEWARREYEHVISKGAEGEQLTAMSRILLAEMLHEQGQDHDAAAALERLVSGLDAGKINESAMYGRSAKEMRARWHYFIACDWASKGDVTKQRASLEKALEADPEDLDSLIASYRLPDQTPEFHAKIVRLIKDAAAKLHDTINADPRNAAAYNQYAWLVGNTEGDYDEAVRCALKSIELRPDEGGYYDTVGHAYFGKGDYENAVKYQTRAAELDRGSGVIKKKLDLFRKKLEETKKK
jgi:tetratricopeptide (TPR) repeat protein